MASQDTINYAQDEEEKARIIQHEIEKDQSDVADLQKDINAKNQIIASQQQKMQQHMKDAQRLREQAEQEMRHEQDELMREQQKGRDSLAQKTAKGMARGFF